MPGEGIKSIRAALRELERAGYLKRVRIRTEAGTFGWEHTFYDTPQVVDLPESGVSAGRTISPKPSDGGPSDGEGRSLEEPRRRTVEEDVPELTCPPPLTSFASGREDDEDHERVEDEPSGEVPTSWRAEDREKFRMFVGEKLSTTGGHWSKTGTWPTDVIYKALTKSKQKKIRWPGRFLDTIFTSDHDDGIDDWLEANGLERSS